MYNDHNLHVLLVPSGLPHPHTHSNRTERIISISSRKAMRPFTLRAPLRHFFIFLLTFLTQAAGATMTCAGDWSGRLTPWHCERALLMRFPNEAQLGDFHHGGPVNIFRLPWSASYGDCRVVVDMEGDIPIRGSWLQFWTLASSLSRACQMTVHSHDFWRGGTVTAGPGDGFKVSTKGTGLHIAHNATEMTGAEIDNPEITTA